MVFKGSIRGAMIELAVEIVFNGFGDGRIFTGHRQQAGLGGFYN
jgi:hypothetical protein